MGPAAKMALALALDLAAAEPPQSLHPVCWMGKAVKLAERAGMATRNPVARRLAGVAAAGGLPAVVFFTTRAVLRRSPPRLAGLTEAVLLYTAIAVRSLGEASRDVGEGLESGLDEGRRRVSHMVGRDTGGLDERGIVRAAVESVAENTNDGVVAPMFYGFIGGAPLALAYKMINTLDSMIGYKNEHYREFGWAAARLDDLAGYVPARLTALAAAAASPLMGADPRGALSVWRRDAAGHESPNAGVCESAFAGALGVCLGGACHYQGRRVELPSMGGGLRTPERSDLGRAAGLMYGAAVIAAVSGAFARWTLAGGRGGFRRRLPGWRRT